MAPFQLPNVLIYLTGVIRPKLLRPHIRVPSITQVDFRSLKKQGYNAVVVDKDNCLTLPNRDEIYPPYQTAWNDLLEIFEPGRVLIVSNSAGTRKDPGGIAAESVSLSLRAPILIHSQNKPGCSRSIISYFKGQLGQPITNRKRIIQGSEKVWKDEQEDEKMLWERWEDEVVQKPLLGYSQDPTSARKGDRVVVERTTPNPISESAGEYSKQSKEVGVEVEVDDLKILVIGDRLFTDTLLSHRLSLHLPKRKEEAVLPSVLSIYTTSLPQPKDVRILRWIEERLSKSQTQPLPGNFRYRFISKSPEEEEANRQISDKEIKRNSLVEALRWLTPSRWREFDKSLPPLTIHPKSWKPLPVLVGVSKSFVYAIVLLVRYGMRGAKKIQGHIKKQIELAKAKAKRIEREKAEESKQEQGVIRHERI
ncbi:hypothetical protein L486_06975 [Kwoniella mangroviensis CBS 10435]|uniref:HAD phosphatase, family IIIA n=1 Tax=Kwoniella mangroviensis CBS 10435 TaxID=1331196 RepID=A0A1B9IJC1_9TREE|nr:hypothetical protein L486_06975 [Kwoniella mangroviensis CBS 10435]